MTRIAWLFEFAELNGAERSLMATLAGIRREGFTPVALAPTEGPLPQLLHAQNVEHVPFDVRDAEGRRKGTSELQKELVSRLRGLDVALLHANSLSMGRLSGPIVARLHVPSIAHMRDIYRLSRQAVNDMNLHTRLLAVSEAVRAFHIDQGVDEAKARVIYNGVDLKAFRPREASGYLHKKLELPANSLLFAAIGQIGLRKAQDVLLHAFARLAIQHPEAHLLIVGERHSQKDEAVQFAEDLEVRARQPDLHGRVHFMGHCNDVASLLPELRGLIHAARQEPLGRVLLEAAACGVPVVTTNVGGTREIFPLEEYGGLLVEADDVAALAFAWERLFDDPVLHKRLADGARRRACEQFPLEKCVENLVMQYKEVLAQRGG